MECGQAKERTILLYEEPKTGTSKASLGGFGIREAVLLTPDAQGNRLNFYRH